MTDRPWFRANPAALEQAVREALVVQPGMRLDDEGVRVVLRGRFEIRHDGELLEAFALDVQMAGESARHPPIVWETGGRIPRERDRHHVNVENDNSLCVLLPDAYWYYHPAGLTLAGFLEGPLREHLAGQAVVLRGGDWPADEWSHGTAGAAEFYREILDVNDDGVLYQLMLSEVSAGSKRRMRCQCGSGKLRRKCHAERLHALRNGPNFTAVLRAVRPQANGAAACVRR